MNRLAKRIGIFFVCLFFFFLPVVLIRADELEDVTKQLETLKADLSKKEADHSKLAGQLEGIKQRVSFIEQEIVKKEKEVRDGEKILDHQRKLLYARARSYYKNINKNAFSLLHLLVADNLSESLQNFFYQSVLVDEDRNEIVKIVLYIKGLEDKKESLARERVGLAAVKEEVDKQAKLLGSEISSTRGKVAELTQKQQSLLAAKQASLGIPRSAGTGAKGCSSDLTNGRDPGFSPKLAAFTLGAPHRNGMSQYGAKGRAEKSSQSYTDILNFYYGGTGLGDVSPDTPIVVDGTNEYGQTFSNESMSLEEYVKHLYEMPASWPAEALKAQAVAARTYGLNRMKALGKVLPNQSHQVVKKEPNAQSWIDAVEATRGKTLGGDSPIFSEYSISHGGYVRNLSKYDGEGGNPGNFADLIARAYDRDSAWFYCDWGSRGEYGGTAWLKTSEMADIANVILLAQRDGGSASHLTQTDAGGDTWDAEKVKSELRKYKTPFNSVNDVSVNADFGSGLTSSVTVSGDAGSETFSGSEFKQWFNVRAPANIFINGNLYNIERR